MTALLRAELVKLRTTRTFVALVGTALALSLLVVGLTTALSDNLTEEDVRDLFTADFSSLFISLLGVMGMAGEWRHKTITSTVLAAPDRLIGRGHDAPGYPEEEPKGLTGMSGGRFSENPTDFSPELTIRARMLPWRGPRMRLRNTPFAPARSVVSLRHLPFRERSIATLRGAAVRGPAPDAHVPLAGAERHEREPERLQRRGLRRVAGDPIGAPEPQTGLDRPVRRPVAQAVPGHEADARVPHPVERLRHPARVQLERHPLRIGGSRVPPELRHPERDRPRGRKPLLLDRRIQGALHLQHVAERDRVAVGGAVRRATGRVGVVAPHVGGQGRAAVRHGLQLLGQAQHVAHEAVRPDGHGARAVDHEREHRRPRSRRCRHARHGPRRRSCSRAPGRAGGSWAGRSRTAGDRKKLALGSFQASNSRTRGSPATVPL